MEGGEYPISKLFGIVSKEKCISNLYYGTDYHGHLGTEFGGIAFIDKDGMQPRLDISI